MDLSLERDLCNEGGCALKRSLLISRCREVLSCFFAVGKMVQTRDLTDFERSTITKSLSKGCNSLGFAKLLGHDHRPVKSFVAYSQQGRKKPNEKSTM